MQSTSRRACEKPCHGTQRVRKQLRVRPGFTPQEDVSRFRGTRQQQHDKNQLPKGHILGWIAPSSSEQRGNSNKKGLSASESASSVGTDGGEKPVAAGMTKNAAKNAKRKAKKQAEKEKAIREAWDEDSEGEKEKASAKMKSKPSGAATKDESPEKSEGAAAADVANETTATTDSRDQDEGDALAKELEKKLDVH
ncbi:hypothetical protein A7U60_g5404 [Sanghuangporus baumii]|uniref:WIBG Mago-binding domain-containing protein n=1 Tax=Sanghuangporus baumii TaxID=108892 RepID=A0A9Q5NBH7_SANBA|nr:hypothetical protein A7U60_g5404 [Sanghuangporus baumii]